MVLLAVLFLFVICCIDICFVLSNFYSKNGQKKIV